MEPMALGSPGGSPGGANPYFPSFLMGESNAPSTSRNNTMSPNTSRNISLGTSGVGVSSPPDYQRSALTQRTLFGYQQQPPQNNSNFSNSQVQNQNPSTGPPIHGLFEILNNEKNLVNSPAGGIPSSAQPGLYGTPVGNIGQFNQSNNQSFNRSINDSYIGGNNYSLRMTSPIPNINPNDYRNGTPNNLNYTPQNKNLNFWLTVYGFPQSATSLILTYFSQCGTIVDKVFPSENGNWVHLKFSSKLECDKALNCNEKIIGNNIMIGVTICKNKHIIDKENICDNIRPATVRSLSQTAFKSAQSDSAVIATPGAPQRSSGLVSKAMDIFFGW